MFQRYLLLLSCFSLFLLAIPGSASCDVARATSQDVWKVAVVNLPEHNLLEFTVQACGSDLTPLSDYCVTIFTRSPPVGLVSWYVPVRALSVLKYPPMMF